MQQLQQQQEARPQQTEQQQQHRQQQPVDDYVARIEAELRSSEQVRIAER